MRMFGGMLWPWMWVGGDEVRLPHHVRHWDADGRRGLSITVHDLQLYPSPGPTSFLS